MTAVVTGGPSVRPATSTIQQWWVLTARTVIPTLRSAELPTQAIASIMFTAQFYIPLNNFLGPFVPGISSYAQYLAPSVVSQAITFAAVSAAFRSAVDSVQGINHRFKALPIGRLIPLSSRMSASMFRIVIALSVAVICGHVIGFRFYGGALHTVGFILFALLIGVTLALLGDLIGAAIENPEATMPILLVPQLVLGLLSNALQPAERFPHWIQPFVRNNPVSQWVGSLRAFAGDSTPSAPDVTWSAVGPGLAWAVGLIAVLLPLHFVVAARRR